MNTAQAISAFDSLAQETRLAAFRLLMEYADSGLPAGILGEKLGIPANTLSFHLAHLAKADLVTTERRGRSIIYRANHTLMANLMRFMVENCCRADKASIHNDEKKNCAVIEIMDCC
jgi:DNA-binding transcriptional ArsR family regulator